MTHIVLVPAAIFLFLVAFAACLWPWQARSTADRGKDTKEHSERIYKVFEFYLQVTLALTAGIGYVRLQSGSTDLKIVRTGMIWLGAIALGVTMVFVIFTWCHVGSKLRRWEIIEWSKLIFLQEIWMALAMFFYGTTLWVVAHTW